MRAGVVALAGLAVLAAAAAAPTPARAFDVIATNPPRYELGVAANIFTIAAVFDATPALLPDASAIRVAGVESGIHFGSFEISGDSLLWHNLSTPFFPGEIVHVNYRRDITSVAGDSLTGGHYFAFTVASGVGTAIWSPRVGYRGADVPYFIYGGDLDEDGTPDLAVPNENTDNVSTFLNPFGSGYFPQRVDYNVGNMPSSCFGEDFNNDGYQDVATGDILGNSVSVLLNEGDGTFAPAVAYASGNRCRQVYGGDFDGDNDIDLCSTSNLTDQVFLFYNNGNGTYAAGVTYGAVQDAPFSVETGDFNLDGHIDIAVACQLADSVTIMTNNGLGGFTTTSKFRIGNNPWESSCNDLDGDGDPDLIFVNSAEDSIAFAFNNGSGAFPTVTKRKAANGAFPLACFVADVDGDGDIDAMSSNFSAGSVRVFVNNGAGVFTINATLQVRVSGSYTWAHDLDGDGDLDLSVADELADSIFVFYNGSSPATDVSGDDSDLEGSGATPAGALALWPNPVRAGTATNLRLDGLSGAVAVDVFAVDGRKVRRIWSGPIADGAQLSWDGRDESGRIVASGRYFVAAASDARTLTREVQIVR